MSEATARKALAVIGDNVHDPDLLQLRARLETGLKAATGAGVLALDELQAIDTLVTCELRKSKHVNGAALGALARAQPKMRALIDRAISG